MKIAIVGAGNMGGAIARGLALGTTIDTKDIYVSNPSQPKLDRLKEEFPDINVSNNNQDVVTGADYIYLAVKPWLVKSVLRSLKLRKSQVLVSVAAAVTFDELAHYLPDKEMAVFRIVPNTAIRVLQSMTLIAEHNVSDEQRQTLTGMLGEMGKTIGIEEKDIAAATALCSCGIAYVMKYAQAAIQAGIELGLRPNVGKELVAQTFKGAAFLLETPDANPSKEIESVCTPGGYTIRGINQLEHDGFSSAIINAMKACMY